VRCSPSTSSIERGVPAVAFSGANSTHRPFASLTNGANDPARIQAKLIATLVDQLAQGVSKFQSRVLPLGVGINVNFPLINDSNPSPAFQLSRLTGGAVVNKIKVRKSGWRLDGRESLIISLAPKIGDDGFPETEDVKAYGLNTALNGDSSLPGETDVVAGGKSSVSVFTVDYDAPKWVSHRLRKPWRVS
jgi:5'-nucleotidase